MKHRLKLMLRESYARALYHSGLWRLVDRLMPRRLTILAGHCVTAPSNARLPKDMKVAEAKLERLLRVLGQRFELTNMATGWRKLGERGTRSLVALTLDDGYKDNRTHLLPLLERLGASATIYLEIAPLEERRVNWSHQFFHALDALGPARFVERFDALCRDDRTRALVRELALTGRADAYQLKRVLKYEAPAEERRRVVERLFEEAGGDQRALCDELYLTWADVHELARRGLDLGGHTVHHEILSRVAEPAAEVAGCRTVLQRELGSATPSFAYPFGRRWDYDARSMAAARAAGFATATTTHAGTNSAASDPYELKRLMIDEDVAVHRVVTEACGGFDLLRRVGIDLSE